MNYLLEKESLTLSFTGEITSSNASEVEKDCENIISKNVFNKLLLDFGQLEYTSSAGLRIILKLKQKYKNVCITNANPNVYDILEMTGFTNILDVKRKLVDVNVDGCKVIGTGFFSTVYRLNQDTIIKVFNRTSDAAQIERELKLAKEAFILGVPTAISFDIVKVNDKLGVRFEMLDCMSLRDAFKDPNQYDYYLNKYVELLKKINTTECNDEEVPLVKAFFIKKMESIKEYLSPDIYNKAYDILKNAPESNCFVHGDCHFKNIMVQGDDLLLIDMDTLSRGSYLFELALIRAPYVAFEEDDPGNSERFLGLPSSFVQQLYNDILDHYIGTDNLKIRDEIAILCYIHMIWWNRVNEPNNMVRFEGCIKRLSDLVKKY